MYRPLPLLQLCDGISADHATVSHDTHLAQEKPGPESIHHGHEAGHVRSVSRPHFATNRTALVVDHRTHHHLLEIRTMILVMAPLTQRLAAFSLEVDGGGVEEHEVKR